MPSYCSEPYSILITQKVNIVNRLLLELVAGIFGSTIRSKIERLNEMYWKTVMKILQARFLASDSQAIHLEVKSTMTEMCHFFPFIFFTVSETKMLVA